MTFQQAMIALNLGGLLLTAIGAGIAARAVIISDAQAATLSGTYWDSNKALEDSLKAQSRSARKGLLLVVLGTILQALAIVGPLLVQVGYNR